MALDDTPSHPVARSYVVRLHRDAAPAQGGMFGRVENISTGRRYFFGNAEELLACFSLDTAQPEPAAATGDDGR